ncbi:MAG: phosphatidylserine decarboxylase [Chrysiogenales bacterium]|nr:MAG: phosphatidylserine decarboxylase [Chrysiogenales bacterium]
MKNKTSPSIMMYMLLPKGLVSRIFGFFTRIPLPAFLMKGLIRWYSTKYNVIDEYITPPDGFKTFNDFFTRNLMDGVRQIDDQGISSVSPVDARIDEYGEILENVIMQAKGLNYTLDELIPSERAGQFEGGSFITLYLSPGDYHRIHSPVHGVITGVYHVPGKLFSVQEFMVKGLPGLFAKNERIITYIDSDAGNVAVCKIGALNVGRITLSYNDIRSNRTFRKRREIIFDDDSRVPVKCGDELGVFNLGSTIILLFQKGSINFDTLMRGKKIRMGERIGTMGK